MAIDHLSDTTVVAVTDVPPMPAQSPYTDPDYTPVKVQPARTGSAAMVVARTTGRGLGAGARWVVGGVARSGRQWVELYHDDYPQIVALAVAERKAVKDTAEADAAKATVKQWRREHKKHRLEHLSRTSLGTLATGGTLAMGGLIVGGWLDLILAGVGLGATAWHGHRGMGPAAIEAGPEHEAITGGPSAIDGSDDDGAPFPLAQCETHDQVRSCIRRALKAEGVPVAEVYDVTPREWGWQCVVRVSEGTPEAIIKVAGALETRFDLPTNGVRPQPMVERRACAILRLVSGDPFATAPGLPYRAPKSLSITDRFRVGTSVGGDPLEVSLAGVMGLWVAASGGGKTGILQALAEGTTACRDNITIDLDPHGDGLEDLHDAVRITARTHKQIEAVLLFFLAMSKARARLRKKLGMGKKWIASPEYPAITIFFDEFPKATELAKRLAFDLLLVGRKEMIEVQIASQGGTKLYLGENVAQMIAMKGVGPCKVGDTRAVFGDGAVSEGWLPHKLSPATDTDSKDAGHIFIQGVPGMADEPIEYKVHEAPAATLRNLGGERRAAGLVEPDQDSFSAMPRVDLPEYVEPVFDLEGTLKKEAPVELLTWEQLLRLCDAEPPAGTVPSLARTVLAESVALMDRFGVDRMRTETLLAALAEYGPVTYGEMTAEGLKALFAEAGVGKPVTLGSLDGLANPRGFKRDQLTAAM